MRKMQMRLKGRRGVTLVLTASMMTGLLIAVGFAVDMSRMYLYRTELQSAADAAALAGVITLSSGGGATAINDALDYNQRNKVGDSIRTLVAGDIYPGNWSLANVWSDRAWTDADANAVKVTTRYPGSFTFGKLAGLTTKNLTATAIAVHGSVGKDKCVRPWAVPYVLMLQKIFAPNPAPDPTTYNLTDADVAKLRTMTAADWVDLKVGDSKDVINSGNFYGVELPPQEYANGTAGSPWSGGSNYTTAISTSCENLASMMGSNPFVGVGDWLAPENGNMKTPTKKAVQDLCGITNPAVDCTTPVRVIIALWDQSGDAPHFNSGCGGKCFHVKYMGVFYVTGYNESTDAVKGFFQTMSDPGGGFVAAPGPVGKNALVR